ncbi:MAG: alpha/beta hydrolase fold protein [Chthonomonadaceae bacterium]|nr:alpha/beta hydrolase fold protein [Chthonomonadaceae bacterium]
MEEQPEPLRTRKLTFKRLLFSVLRVLAGVYLGLFCYAYFFTEKTIFQPPPSSYQDTDRRIFKLPSGDGAQISAVYLPNPKARYTLLYSHGNAEDIGQNLQMFTKLKEMGFAVLAYDYHGYGTSPGTPTEANAYQDEEAAYNYLIKDRGVPADHIIAIGHSLGSAMAIDLASRQSLGGLIVESAFLSADRIVTRIPLLPLDTFQNLTKISKVHCPVLVMHGRQDRVVPFWHGERLFASANEPKQALWIEGAGHNDLVEILGPRYGQALKSFAALVETGQKP